LKHANRYNEFIKDYTWENCKAGREEYGKFLISYISNAPGERLVANLDGSWGTGKTNLLRRMYVELAQQNKPVIYIDAWESDFSKNPLSVVSSEILRQLESIFHEIDGVKSKEANLRLENIKSCIGIALKLAKPLSLLYQAYTGDSSASTAIDASKSAMTASNNISKYDIENVNSNLADKAKSEHFEMIDAMRKLKEHINFLAELLENIHEYELPIVVLIDELDRCRPTYAIEMLEVIKHFFDVKGYVFLVATDTGQLEHSIKAVYGQGFDSKSYLKRFFDRKILLKNPDFSEYLERANFDFLDTSDSSVFVYPFLEIPSYRVLVSKIILTAYSGSLNVRDVEQILSKYEASIRFLKSQDRKIYVCFITLLIGTIEYHKGDDIFFRRNSENNNLNNEPKVSLKGRHRGIMGRRTNVNDVELRELIVACFKSSFKVEITKANKPGGRTTIFGNPTIGLSWYTKSLQNHQIDSWKFSHEFDKVNDAFEKEFLDEGRCIFYLWNDYQALIELSGCIEK